MNLKQTRSHLKPLFSLSILLLFFLQTFSQICGLPGSDGPATTSSGVNTYFPSANPDSVPAGATSLTLGATSGTSITPGDMVLIIQMKVLESMCLTMIHMEMG